MVRGTGKYKQKRGGGRQFSRNLVLDKDGTAVSTDRRWAPRDKKGSDDDSDEEEEEEEGEEESEEEEESGGEDKAGQPEMTRAERRELKKKQAAEKAKKAGDGDEDDDDDDDLINPNHVTKKMNISDLNAPRELTRREREAKEKKEAQDRYWKLHVQGKTEQAKTDLARLAKIRAEREAAQEKRKAEQEAKNAEIEQKAAAQKQRKR